MNQTLSMKFIFSTCLALVFSFGCASGYSKHLLPDGLTVHTFRREHSNVHVVTNGSASFMIDAGFERNASALTDDMLKAGIDPKALRAIILTHGHTDHAGGAHYFQRHFGTQIIAGSADLPLMSSGRNEPKVCPTDFIARQRMQQDLAETYTPFEPNTRVNEPLALEPLFGIKGTVQPLPGHTPGSLVVVFPHAVFVGDLLRGSLIGHAAELHFYMCDLEDNRKDVQHVLDTLAPNATLFFPGHFGPIERAEVQKRFVP